MSDMDNKIQTTDTKSNFYELLEIVADQQDLIMKLFHEGIFFRNSREGRKAILDLSCRINTKVGKLFLGK